MTFKITSDTSKKHRGYIFVRDHIGKIIYLTTITKKALRVMSFDGETLIIRSSNLVIKAKKVAD